MAPNGARIIFFLLIQTLPTFWAERILISRFFIFGIFLDPKFPDFQVPDFQISRNLAWAGRAIKIAAVLLKQSHAREIGNVFTTFYFFGPWKNGLK